jgi:hypothetical protein
MKRILFTFLQLLTLSLAAQNIRLYTVYPLSDLVVFKNYDTGAVNIARYRISDGTIDTPLIKLTIVAADIYKTPDSLIVKTLSTVWIKLPLNNAKGSVSLHLPDSDVTKASSMIDFFQYGDSGQAHEHWADSMGLWTQGQFAPVPFIYFWTGTPTQRGLKYWNTANPPVISLRMAAVNVKEKRIYLKNAGTANLDLTAVTICINGVCHDSLATLSVKKPIPNLKSLSKNDTASIWLGDDIKLDSIHGSITFFAWPQLTDDTATMLDFIQWGDSLMPYSTLAHTKGIWDSTKTLHYRQPTDSFIYTGNFTRSNVGITYWMSDGAGFHAGISMIGADYFLYPNPANSELNIQGASGRLTYEILNMQGESIMKGLVESKKIITDKLSSGIYIIRLFNEQGQTNTHKISIIR